MTTDTVTWAVTFGLGTEHKHTYTEVHVPAAWSRAEQESAVHTVAYEAYGKVWAFAYPPEKVAASVHAYGITTVRETIDVASVPGVS